MKTHTHRYKTPKPGDIFKFCSASGCEKRKKVFSVKKERKALQEEAEDLWREYAHKRDGAVCQIQKHFPHLNLNHSSVIQVDHFFPRADKNLFFETSNATCLCNICNYLKSNGSPQSTQILIAVQDIVFKREGEDKFTEMLEINNKRVPNRDWGREYYLHKIIEGLENKVKGIQTEQL